MLKIQEAADRLNISPSTLTRLISNGDIAYIPVGLGGKRRHVRIDEKEIERFKARQWRISPLESISPVVGKHTSTTLGFTGGGIRDRLAAAQREKLQR